MDPKKKTKKWATRTPPKKQGLTQVLGKGKQYLREMRSWYNMSLYVIPKTRKFKCKCILFEDTPNITTLWIL
jgi:hypothetical protein